MRIHFNLRKHSSKETPKAVQRTILDLLAKAPERVELAQIAARLGLSAHKTSRVIRPLVEQGLVEGFQGRYRLVFSAAVLTQKQHNNKSVIEAAHPVLEQLAHTLDEAVYLAIPKDAEVLFLDMADCSRPVKSASVLGRLFPFFSSAAGKVMRCLDSRDLVERLLKKFGRNKGVRAMAKLELELQEIRSRGVAVDRGVLGEGICSVAVAVRDYSGAVVAAIILIGPSFRIMTERMEQEIIPALKQGAAQLSENFGFCPA